MSKVDWIPIGERLPPTHHSVWYCTEVGVRTDYGFYTGKEWLHGGREVSGVTHWAFIEWPEPPEPKRIETRVKITKANSDGYSHEAVFIAEIPRSFIGKTLNVVLEKV